MRKIIIALMLLSAMGVNAQEVRNATYQVIINDVKYAQHEQQANLGEVLGSVAHAIRTGREYQYGSPRTDYNDAVLAAIVRGLSETYRLRVIDGTNSMAGLTQKHDFDMDITVSNIATTSRIVTETVKEKKDGKETERKVPHTYHKGIVDVTLLLKEVGTGEVIYSPSFNLSSNDSDKNKTSEEALSQVMRWLSARVSNFFNKKYPLSATILEGAAAKKNKMKEVYIDLGSEEGAVKGMHLAVYTVKTIGGNEAKEQIGKLSVTDVQGENVSLCKVQSGGKDIKAALDAGTKLVVMTTN